MHFSLKLLLHFSNLLTVEVKLGVHVYYVISMTTTTNKFTSSLLKLANSSTHGDEHGMHIISMTTTGIFSSIINFYRGLPPSNVVVQVN